MITVIIPSKGRPDKIKAALTSLNQTTKDFEVLVGLEEGDDKHYSDWEMSMLCSEAKRFSVYVFPPNLGCSGKVNRLCNRAEGDWIMGAADDLIWHTHGWDKMLEAHKPSDGIICVYCKDDPNEHRGPIADDGVPGIPIVTREFYKTVGFYPAHFFHFYGDTWSTDIARRVGRLKYIDDIVICICTSDMVNRNSTRRTHRAERHKRGYGQRPSRSGRS